MSDTTYDPSSQDARENRVKVGHLVIGLVFIGIAGSWALRAGGAIGDLEIGVLIPVVLVLAGVVGLIATVVGSRRRRARPAVSRAFPETPVEPAYAAPVDAGSDGQSEDRTGPHTEETAPIGSLPLDEPKEQP